MPIRLLANCNFERDFAEEYHPSPTLFMFTNLYESGGLTYTVSPFSTHFSTEHVRYTSLETSFRQYPDRHANFESSCSTIAS